MRRVAVLGMMAKKPVPGVIWQTIHYLLGLRRLGFDPYYVEAHALAPSMLMELPTDDGAERAATLIDRTLRRFDLGDRWAYQALHGNGQCFGLSESELRRLYRESELILNLHGGTLPWPELAETGRLVLVETDPVRLQIELHDRVESSISFLEAHSAFFTFAENLGTPACLLPVPADFHFQPTRQPVALELWQREHALPKRPVFTTVGNWRQRGRSVSYQGETYDWSKDLEWRKFLDLPTRTRATFELALSRSEPGDSEELERCGFHVRDALEFDLDSYRSFIGESLGEFTVAKDQNIRFATGWFSDRGATYLASGRPVITQDTGFGEVLPTGEGLFAISSVDEAAAAVESVRADPKRQSRLASEIAREYFDAERVLGELLAGCGVSRGTTARSTYVTAAPPVAKERRRLGPQSSVLAVIPHYRCEEWLDDCLASLVNQTRSLDGIVVIDDASDDPPLRTVQRYPEVTLLHADRNVGPYRLVQQVIEETDYDAYLFQDADDWSAPERLELLLRGAERCEAELIGTQEIRVFCDEPEVVPIPWPLDVHAEFEERATAFPLLHPTSLVSRDLVLALGGFASGLRFSGDAEFLRRARFVSHVANIPEYLYYRRIREGSLTTAPATNLQSPERKRVMEMLWERARRNADLVAGGSKPELEPCRTAPRVGLAHLAGPSLRGAGRPVSRQGASSVSGSEPGARSTEHPGAPVFIVGPDRSGISALAWAIAEHRRFEVMPDEWTEDETTAEFGARLQTRPQRVVDGSRRCTHEILDLASLFPDSLFVHVVRDVDSVVSVMTEPPLSAAGATGGTQVPAHLRAKLGEAEAVETWRAATQACIDAEATLGSTRVLRVSFDALIETPEAVLRSCLGFAGEDYEAECLRPLRRTRARRAMPNPQGASPASDARAAVRQLSRSLLARPDFIEAEKARMRTLSRTTAREVLSRYVPGDGLVAIVTRGDEELLRCAPGGARHVPQDRSGSWAGHHPADASEAIAEVEAAREGGAAFLYVPCTSMWWLDHYDGLRQHLESRHRMLTSSPEEGALYGLTPVVGALEPTTRATAEPGARERVVLVTDHFPKYSETFFAAEFLGLLGRGWDIHVLCNRSNRDQWPYFPELSDHLASGERIHVIRDFDAQLEELSPAVVHFGYGTLARERMHIGHVLGCKTVVSFRGYDINYFGLDDPHCYDDVWAATDVLHLVSEDIWRRAQRRRCPPDKPHLVITDAVDMASFTPPDRRSEPAGTEDRPLRIVSVGRLHWKKGYEHALLALSALHERGIHFEYRIVGDGPHREAILFALDELDLSERVELLGARNVSEVQATMEWGDVCLHAAVSEGFCVSVIEAQAMALPIVCTDADGLAENVADGVTGFVVPRREPGALTSKLAALAADPELRLRFGKAGRERAERLFDLPRQLDGLESLYELALRVPASPDAELPRADASLEALEHELAGLDRRRDALAKHVRGRRVAARVRSDTDRLLPDDATVLIVSRGDEELLRIGRRDARHFPQTSDGGYAGHHPADSTAAVQHLESLRSNGASHLVIPATSDWWLEHYAGFRQHLEERYVQVFADPDSCVIYALDNALSATGQAA
jgi:glycosyltransferase involved in cell wall biosynthesis